jgi:hypothetical protein
MTSINDLWVAYDEAQGRCSWTRLRQQIENAAR